MSSAKQDIKIDEPDTSIKGPSNITQAMSVSYWGILNPRAGLSCGKDEVEV